jgi:hypothetical protein
MVAESGYNSSGSLRHPSLVDTKVAILRGLYKMPECINKSPEVRGCYHNIMLTHLKRLLSVHRAYKIRVNIR